MSALILRRRKLGRTSVREISAKSRQGILNIRNDKPFPHNLNLIFRWGCTSDVPEGVSIVNSARAIHLAADKAECRRVFGDLSPKTWFDLNDRAITYPCIVRPRQHHQGRRLYVCNNLAEVVRAAGQCGPGYYISEYIDKVAEYRVFVVQGRCVCVAKKTPADANAVAWNVAQGGRFDNVRWDDWPLKAVKVSIQAFNKTGLDFGGVDIMVDREGNCYVLEINSAPSLTSEYRQSCMAKAFDYIVEHGKEHFPSIDDLPRGGYRKFIHPAIVDNA